MYQMSIVFSGYIKQPSIQELTMNICSAFDMLLYFTLTMAVFGILSRKPNTKPGFIEKEFEALGRGIPEYGDYDDSDDYGSAPADEHYDGQYL